MMIHYDQIGFLRVLMHGGDKTAVEIRAFLTGAQVAAGIDAVPQLGVVRQKGQLAAISGLSKLSPIADLREPVGLVDTFQYRLPVDLIYLRAAKKIVTSLHQGSF